MGNRFYFMGYICSAVVPALHLTSRLSSYQSLFRRPHHLVLELRRKTLVGNEQLLALLDQIRHLLLQVGSRLLLQPRKLHVERLFPSTNRGLLELSVRPLANLRLVSIRLIEDMDVRFWALGQPLDKLLQCNARQNLKRARNVARAADRTVVFFLVLKRIRIYRVVARIHHVVVHAGVSQEGIAVCGDFERLIAAACGDNGVGAGNGRDDVLDHALRHAVCYAFNIELLGPGGGFVEEPGNVLWVVRVEGHVLALFLPRDDVCPLNAMLGLSWDRGECAERHCRTGRVHV